MSSPGTNKLRSSAFCFSTENFTSILLSTLTLIADLADGRTDGRTDADGGRGCCAAAVLLMNSGGACVERRRRVNEIIEGREREGEGTNRSVWVYAACVVDMDTIIIACGLE